MNNVCCDCGCFMLSGYVKRLNVCIGGYDAPEPPEYEEVLECPKCTAYKSYQEDVMNLILPETEYASEEIVDLIIKKYPNQGLYVNLIFKSILHLYRTGKIKRRNHPFLKNVYLYSSPDKIRSTDTAMNDRELAEIPF